VVLTSGLRRLTFTTHITSSLGWVGAVITFLALAVTGLTSTVPLGASRHDPGIEFELHRRSGGERIAR